MKSAPNMKGGTSALRGCASSPAAEDPSIRRISDIYTRSRELRTSNSTATLESRPPRDSCGDSNVISTTGTPSAASRRRSRLLCVEGRRSRRPVEVLRRIPCARGEHRRRANGAPRSATRARRGDAYATKTHSSRRSCMHPKRFVSSERHFLNEELRGLLAASYSARRIATSAIVISKRGTSRARPSVVDTHRRGVASSGLSRRVESSGTSHFDLARSRVCGSIRSGLRSAGWRSIG